MGNRQLATRPGGDGRCGDVQFPAGFSSAGNTPEQLVKWGAPALACEAQTP